MMDVNNSNGFTGTSPIIGVTIFALSVLLGLLFPVAVHGAASMPFNTVEGDVTLDIQDNGRFSICYQGKVVVRNGVLEFASKEWVPTAYAVKLSESLRDGRKEIKLSFSKGGSISADQVFFVSSDSIDCTVDYEVKEGTIIRHVAYDLALDKRLVEGCCYRARARAESGTKELKGVLSVDMPAQAVPGISELEIGTGTFSLTFNGSYELLQGNAGLGSSWLLRNVCKRDFGFRTFTILHEADMSKPESVKCHLAWSMKFKKNYDPAADAKYAVAGMERGLAVLLGKSAADKAVAALPQEPVERARALWDVQGAAAAQWESGQAAALRNRKAVVIPEPQEMRLGDGVLPLARNVRISTAADLSEKEANGIGMLLEELRDRYGLAAGTGSAGADVQIVVGEPWRNPKAAELLTKWGLRVDAGNPGPEGYVLKVTPEVALVAGSDAAGTFYGIQSLIQLLRLADDGAVSLPAVEIRDWPVLKRRVLYFETAGQKDNIDYLRRRIRYHAARYKTNMVVVGACSVGYKYFKWKSHPEIKPSVDCLTVEEFAKEADYARLHFLEFVPFLPSLSHVPDLLKFHPELAEADGNIPSNTGCGYSGLSYCPSNPDTYKLLFDLWGEFISAVKPKYMVIGHDEISHIGICDRCKGKTHADLFADDVIKLHDWLKARGVEAMMCQDMLLNREEWKAKGLFAANGTSSKDNPFGTDKAIDRIPKDIVIIDWHYRATGEFPSFEYLKGKGFKVIGSTWYTPENNYAMSVAAEKASIWGMWCGDFGMFGTRCVGATTLLGSAYAWSPGRPSLDKLPYDPVHVLGAALRTPMPSDNPDASFIPLDIEGKADKNIAAKDWRDRTSWFGQGMENDLWMFHCGQRKLNGQDFLIPGDGQGRGKCIFLPDGGRVAGIPVNRRAESVLLLTAMQSVRPAANSSSVTPPKTVAELTFKYEDGSTAKLSLREGRHVTDWRTFAPRDTWCSVDGYDELPDAKPAFRGYTRFGEAINLQSSELPNPYPGKTISSLDLNVAKGSGFQLAVLGVTLVETGNRSR